MASIERNAQSQARVVEDLIELSRVVTGKLQLRSQPLDLRAVVEAALDVVRTAAAAKGVTLESKLHPTPAIVSGDRDRLQQVVCICDLAMPGMDGYEVLRTIRRTTPVDSRQSLAIALTDLASDSDRQAVLDAGFDDHIVKPFNFPDLLRAVSRTRVLIPIPNP